MIEWNFCTKFNDFARHKSTIYLIILYMNLLSNFKDLYQVFTFNSWQVSDCKNISMSWNRKIHIIINKKPTMMKIFQNSRTSLTTLRFRSVELSRKNKKSTLKNFPHHLMHAEFFSFVSIRHHSFEITIINDISYFFTIYALT